MAQGRASQAGGTECAVALKREFRTHVCRSVEQVEARCEVGCTGKRVSVSRVLSVWLCWGHFIKEFRFCPQREKRH